MRLLRKGSSRIDRVRLVYLVGPVRGEDMFCINMYCTFLLIYILIAVQ